ncbi:glycosyltransferase family 4 protein [Butyrivibrio sp. NC3005]|uniref:glycosyltransferase family 4 protein n=1 Tax=Butyrivibrio sp. NC3005 TaxID=1280685 RepID=UPI000428BC6F|nr:glycosyltransferase family 4 protein [Butyrivibrio sp. NC3005]
MKVLLIDGGVEGHFEVYRNTIIENISAEYMLVLPVEDATKYNTADNVKKIGIPEFSYQTLSFENYLIALKKLKHIVREEKPDLIHFLAGDYLNLYAGFGMQFLKRYRVIATYHHVTMDYDRKWYKLFMRLSMLRVSRMLDTIVVHSDYLCSLLGSQGIKNGKVVHYPSFLKADESAKKDSVCPPELNDFNKNTKVILALGATRRDKGLDILLKALQSVNCPFHLIIAGKEQDIATDEIMALSSNFSRQITMIMRYISDSEMRYLIQHCDIVAVPYRREFNGASGPMIDGVAYGKWIIGPDCGEIGNTISKYHLGEVFQAENVQDLSKKMQKLLLKDYEYDDMAKAYVEKLSRQRFVKGYMMIYFC